MLVLDDITCRYGSVTAVRNVSLEVRKGEVVTLLGSNGAGKSTIIKTIGGLLPPAEGTITFAGGTLTGLRPYQVAGAGISVVLEGHRLFGTQSVDDNLLLGGFVQRNDRERLGEARARVLDLFPVLGDRLSHPAASLSGGQQQMLAIAQGLMGSPRLLVLDEPSLGLAPSIVEQVFGAIARLREADTTILLVEQLVHQALRVSDRAYVLQTGQVIGEGTADELRSDPRLREAYLGAVGRGGGSSAPSAVESPARTDG